MGRLLRMGRKIKAAIGAAIIIALFIVISYFMSRNVVFFENLITGNEIWGSLIYILILAFSVVIAPVSSLPLIPVASNIYGVLITRILTMTGWLLGEIIAFGIARKWGKPIVKRLVKIKELEKIECRLHDEHKFFTLVLFRIFFFPADILSYALGLFTNVSWRMFIITSFIGVLPMAFLFAYLGTLPILIQVIFFVIGLLVVLSVAHILIKHVKSCEIKK